MFGSGWKGSLGQLPPESNTQLVDYFCWPYCSLLPCDERHSFPVNSMLAFQQLHLEFEEIQPLAIVSAFNQAFNLYLVCLVNTTVRLL